MSAPPKKECPPVGRTTGGQCIAVEASAGTEYATGEQDGNSDLPPADSVLLAYSARTRNGRVRTRQRGRGADTPKATFCSPDGRKWAYRGKRAQVLAMLAETRDGITQWDTLPWHTRLGGTVHAMRCDGLEISTELEGEFRHARYRLHTRGRLLIQAENRREAVIIHRDEQ